MDEIVNLKIKLYGKLLDKKNEDLTNEEVELIYCFSRDQDIQNILSKNSKANG